MLTMVNSSSMAMTTSTASSESKPRSVVNDEAAETFDTAEHERKATNILSVHLRSYFALQHPQVKEFSRDLPQNMPEITSRRQSDLLCCKVEVNGTHLAGINLFESLQNVNDSGLDVRLGETCRGGVEAHRCEAGGDDGGTRDRSSLAGNGQWSTSSDERRDSRSKSGNHCECRYSCQCVEAMEG